MSLFLEAKFILESDSIENIKIRTKKIAQVEKKTNL